MAKRRKPNEASKARAGRGDGAPPTRSRSTSRSRSPLPARREGASQPAPAAPSGSSPSAPRAPASAFGKYLRERRRAAGLSLEELAKLVGVSYEFLGQVERGVRPAIRRERWPALAAAIPGVTVDELERRSAESRPVAIDVSEAPQAYEELALLLSRRIRGEDLDRAQLAEIVELLQAGAGAAVRAHGRVLDASGAPLGGTVYIYRLAPEPGFFLSVGDKKDAGTLSGPLYGRVAHDTGKTADLLPAGDPRGAGFFDLPGGLVPGEYFLHVHHDGREEWAWPFTVTDGRLAQDVRVGGPASGSSSTTIPPLPPPPLPDTAPPVTSIDRQFTAGTFTASFSYYGLGGAPIDRIQRDLQRFRLAGFSHARVWTEWERPSAAGRILNRDGSPIADQVAKLEKALDFAVSLGMTFDLTMAAGKYDRTKRSGEGESGYDIGPHKKALTFLLSHFKGHAGIGLVDAGNECNERGPGGSGDPQYGHVSPGRAKELLDVARVADPARRVSFSITGDPETCIEEYQKIQERGAVLPIFLPHFPRDKGWGANEGARAKTLRGGLGGAVLVHDQEPARRNYPTPGQGMWPVSEFENSFRSSRANGSVGCCFHTGACFDLTSRDGWDQLDDVERQVVAHLAEWIR